jgi:hypothetical protein
MQCAVCYRKAENEYCYLHEEAFKNILSAYQKWNSSKTITWPDYLKKIRENPSSGQWVIEVCGYILGKEREDQLTNFHEKIHTSPHHSY